MMPWCRTGLLLLAMQPLVLPAVDTTAVPLIARGDRSFPLMNSSTRVARRTASTSIFSRPSPADSR